MRLDSHSRTLGDMTGRTALVTGASSGIGEAAVKTFLHAGARVHAVARREERLRQIDETALADGRLFVHPLDVTDQKGTQRLADTLAETDPIDTLFLAAGQNINPRTFGDLTFEAFDHLMKVNLSSAFYALRATLPQLRENNGDVVIISSVAAFWPDHSGAAYQASKAGVTAMARGAARDEHSNGIRITSILPGAVNTPILDKRPTPPPDEIRAWFIQPGDVATSALAAITIPGRTTVSEITLTPTRLQSIGNTQQATPILPEGLVNW